MLATAMTSKHVWMIAALASTTLACGDSSADEDSASTSTSDASSSSSTMTETTATATGETSEGSETETGGEPEPEPELDCGTPSYAGLRRAPYLQSVMPDSVRVAWAAELAGEGVLRVGSSADGPWSEIPATAELFTTERTTEEVEYTAYDAMADGLEPGTQYCYEVWLDGEAVATGLRLETAWLDDRAVRIIAFGDSGNASPEQMAVRDRMLERDFDVFLHLGDMAYGDGTFPEFKQRVFDIYADFLHATPTWPTMGNHEFKTEQGQPYLDLYYLPEVALDPAQNERYYSFDYGDVHFVSLDTNDLIVLGAIAQDANSDTTMLDWLRQDLAESDKPWKIAFFHHPPYSSSERPPNFVVIDGIVPLLEDGGVDIVLSGHDHHYERTVPIKAGATAPHEQGGIYYFVAGAGGAGVRDAFGDWWTEVYNDEKHNYLSLTIDGCTAIGEVVDLDGETLDSFELPGC